MVTIGTRVPSWYVHMYVRTYTCTMCTSTGMCGMAVLVPGTIGTSWYTYVYVHVYVHVYHNRWYCNTNNPIIRLVRRNHHGRQMNRNNTPTCCEEPWLLRGPYHAELCQQEQQQQHQQQLGTPPILRANWHAGAAS
jgi:hypothetical protein